MTKSVVFLMLLGVAILNGAESNPGITFSKDVAPLVTTQTTSHPCR
jgi:hypothetical protein